MRTKNSELIKQWKKRRQGQWIDLVTPDYRFSNYGEEINFLREVNRELLEACKDTLNIINSYSHIPAQFKACKILQQAISKAEG